MLASGFANTVGTPVQSGEGMLGQLPLLAARPEACWASACEDPSSSRGRDLPLAEGTVKQLHHGKAGPQRPQVLT